MRFDIVVALLFLVLIASIAIADPAPLPSPPPAFLLKSGWVGPSTDNFARPDSVPDKTPGSTDAVGNNWIDVDGGSAQLIGGRLDFVRGGTLARPDSEVALDQRIVVETMPAPSGLVFALLRGGPHFRDCYECGANLAGKQAAMALYRIGSDGPVEIGKTTVFSPVAGHAYLLDFSAQGSYPTQLLGNAVDKTTGEIVSTATATDSGSELQGPGSSAIRVLGGDVDVVSATIYRRAVAHATSESLVINGPSSGEVGSPSDRFWVSFAPGSVIPTAPVDVVIVYTTVRNALDVVHLSAEHPSASFFLKSPPVEGTLTVEADFMLMGFHNDATFTFNARRVNRVPATDPHIYWSPYVWRADSGTMQTTNAGAYMKFRTASSSVEADFDATPYAAVDPVDRPHIGWLIDGVASKGLQLPASGRVPIASSLPPGEHDVTIYVKDMKPGLERWFNPINRVRLRSLVLSDGATVESPHVATHTTFLLWDSIGYECDQDSFKTFVRSFADGIDSEVGRDSNGGQGYTVTGFTVPPAAKVWSDYYDGVSRLVNGRLDPPPNYIVVGHGTNDFLRGTKNDDVTAAVVSMLTGLRTAAPAAKIVVVIPFGGYKRDPITAGFKAYVDAAADKQAYLIDLGAAAQVGIDKPGTTSAHSYDGIHPNAAWAADLGGQLAAAFDKAVPESDAGTLSAHGGGK